MKIILIESTLYKVTEKEFAKIKELSDKLTGRPALSYEEAFKIETKLSEFLQSKEQIYKKIGELDFQYRF
jgi:hypothetical protein